MLKKQLLTGEKYLEAHHTSRKRIKFAFPTLFFGTFDILTGAKVRMLGPEARCIQCHQESAPTKTVDETIMGLELVDPDVPSAELGFINSHFTSGATPFGADDQGAYQYSGKNYAGRFNRGDEFFACVQCHDQHSLEIKVDTCGECHTIAGTETRDIRVDTTDFYGDGNITEGIAYEVSAIHSELDPEENHFDNSYNAWTPRLLRAAYNSNYATHDPGAYAHNSDYILQVLYDSLADLGGDTTALARP